MVSSCFKLNMQLFLDIFMAIVFFHAEMQKVNFLRWPNIVLFFLPKMAKWTSFWSKRIKLHLWWNLKINFQKNFRYLNCPCLGVFLALLTWFWTYEILDKPIHEPAHLPTREHYFHFTQKADIWHASWI